MLSGERPRRMYCMNVIGWMYVCYKNMKNKQKEWHTATKPLNSCSHWVVLNIFSSRYFWYILSQPYHKNLDPTLCETPQEIGRRKRCRVCIGLNLIFRPLRRVSVSGPSWLGSVAVPPASMDQAMERVRSQLISAISGTTIPMVWIRIIGSVFHNYGY